MTAPDLVVDVRGLSRGVRLPGGGDLQILHEVDLQISRGESVAIVGQSGSGKSTLLAILGLLSRPAAGAVSILGQDAAKLSDAKRARLRNGHLGFVFQSYSLLKQLNAAKNVELPLQYGDRQSSRQRRRASTAALDAVGLGERRRSMPRHLSGGEQQRVAIARALVRRPDVVLADEPTGALDVATGETVLDVLFDATTDRGATLVLVTHEPAIAARADRTLILDAGVLREG